MNPNMKRRFKLKITEEDCLPQDKVIYKEAVLFLMALRSLAKNKDASDVARSILKHEIKELRSNVLNSGDDLTYTTRFASKFYNLTIQLGPHKKSNYLVNYPTRDDIQDLKTELLDTLAKGRREKKLAVETIKEYNGIEYKTVGNVFAKTGTILSMPESPGYSQRIRKAKRPYDKSNYVGVELELICDVDRDKLNALFVTHKLAGQVYVKGDSSIRAEADAQHTHEVTIIAKQKDVHSVIQRVCAVLNSAPVNAFVNDSCGMHVHMDMRNRNPDVSYTNLFNMLPILAGMVPTCRRTNIYCELNSDPVFKTARSSGRRQAINPSAYSSHQTIEVRLHSGTVNPSKILNWIELLIAAVEPQTVLAQAQMSTIADMALAYNLPTKLIEYVVSRTDKFKKAVTTKQDHLDLAV